VAESDENRCAGPGCHRWLAPSTGPTPRKWCSDVCRKRAARAAAVTTQLDAGATGHVGESVDALVESLDPAVGTLAASLASLARSTARLVDQGQPQAVAQLRLTLEALDEAARITERDSGTEWFNAFDIYFALTPQGLRRNSDVGRAVERFAMDPTRSGRPLRGLDRKFMPFDRPWACPACGFQPDREGSGRRR
jgi:hypothetical protein